MKNHIGKFSNTLAYMKYFLKHILSIGFQFWEPPRGALHWSNFDFFIWTPLPNTLVHTHNENLHPTFLEMLKCNFALFSIWQASTWQTAAV